LLAPHRVRTRSLLFLFTASLTLLVSALGTWHPLSHSSTERPAAASRVLAQGGALAMPDLQTTLQPRGLLDLASLPADRSARPHSPDRLLGQEGFGDSALELQSLHDGEIEVRATFASKIDGRRISGSRRVPAGGSTLMRLDQVAGLSSGSYASRIDATGAFGAIARTRWSSGATTAVAAVSAATELLLPLMMVDTYGHTTILALMNSHEQASTQVDLVVRENDTGGNLLAFGADLEPLGATTWDTKVETILFGRSNLPRAAHGGYVGALLIKAGQPVSLLAYGDESEAGGSSAIVARPVSDAEAVQHLPLVRRGADGAGGTLIAVANAERKPGSITIRYHADDGSLAAEQTFDLAPDGAQFIDLAGRDRGTYDAPNLPTGFQGAATIEADVAILAAAQDEQLVDGLVDALAGYNALGSQELGTRVGLPLLRRLTDFVTSAVRVYNPSDATATVRLELFNTQGAALPGPAPELSLPAGGSAVFDLREVAAFPAGQGRAHVVADRSVAVLQYDSRDDSIEYPLPVFEVGLSDERNSNVEGAAIVRTVEGNNGIRVDISLTNGANGSYKAFIQDGTCTLSVGDALHELNDVVGGRSGTVLPNADLRSVADGGHAIRLTGAGRMGTRPVACGIIPAIRGVEVADASLSRGFVLERVAAPPVATATATTEATTPPDPAKTATPRPTVDPTGRTWLYLPRTLRE
jgi:hypothetical protein